MATLDRVIGLQQQGLSDTDIYKQLQNEGISPKEINDSLNQAKIKNAVSSPETNTQSEQSAQPPSKVSGMQQSIMTNPNNPATSQQNNNQNQTPTPQTPSPEIYPPQQTPTENYQQQNYTGTENYPTQEYQQQDYSGQQQYQNEYYPQTPQSYEQQDYYTPQQGGTDTETMSEIAEQIATEKLNEFKNKTGDIVSFKNNIQDKVNDIDDRLKRIETTIDKLQQAIIGKIGEFGENNAMIHKDLNNLHGTVSNLMNPLIDNINELRKLSK